jgi:S1-C subfamily serine protease
MFKQTPFLALLLLLLAGVHARASENGTEREAIVKIYSIQNHPDYYNPWSMRGSRNGTGSGCVIKGRKILTNAHVISDQTFVQVRRYGEAKRYEARVVSISHEADLALLSVEDEKFFEGVTELEFGELPETQAEVLVYGFPLGGDTLSITKGVVSRVEHQTYAHSSSHFLAGQIDAAINPGNSGGPVLQDGKLVGVVMQAITRADNIGYMVPVNIVKHFMEDLEDGNYDGFPSLGIALQSLENPDMKKYLGVSEDQSGMVIIRVLPGSPADGQLQKGDVLLSVEGHAVADNGTVEFRPKERTSVSYYIQERQVGDTVRLDILREGEPMTLNIEVNRSTREDALVATEQYDVVPSYYIYGGVVFCPLTKDFLKAWGSNWYNQAPKNLVAWLSGHAPERDGEEIIILLKVLAADVNQGYHNYLNWVIEKVNGEEVLNLSDLVEKVQASSEKPYVVFESENGQQIIIDRAKADATHEEILARYRIPADRSDDLKETAPVLETTADPPL